jgi:hypothetical protein
MSTIEILLPTPAAKRDNETATFDLGRRLAGARIGLRYDQSWRSYFTVVDEWERMLQRDGASVHRFVAGDRAGPGAAATRDDLEEWSRLVEVGVVGLGN